MVTVASIVSMILRIYEFLILIRVLLSWVNPNPYRPAIDHPIYINAVRLLFRVTDPVLEPLRRLIPPVAGAIDFSPVIALILLEVLRSLLVRLLLGL
jgi:YggT family protein